MADDPDDVRLPKPPSPLTPPEPQVLPPMSPSFAPTPTLEPGTLAFEMPPPDFRSRRRVDPDRDGPPPDLPDLGAMSCVMPQRRSSGAALYTMITMAIGVVIVFAVVGFQLLKRSPSSTAIREEAGFRVIDLPPGQHLISAEIGDAGQVFYRYAPLLPGEQPRTSTLDGRTSDWRFLERIHFIEHAAE